jgi:hypothetical protein
MAQTPRCDVTSEIAGPGFRRRRTAPVGGRRELDAGSTDSSGDRMFSAYRETCRCRRWSCRDPDLRVEDPVEDVDERLIGSR